MTPVTVDAAETTLSLLLVRVEAGEEIILARGATPVPRLVRYQASAKRRRGALKVMFKIGPEFFEPLPAEELDFWDQ